MTKTLTIGRSGKASFIIPIDVVTEKQAIIGRTGSGKTHTAAVYAEEILASGHQVVIVDPLDVWWGLRSNAAGTGPGYPIVVFGGQRADLPLQADDGSVIADAIVDHGFSAVVSLAHLSKSQQRQFMTAFATQIYERKTAQVHRTPMHLFLDEADLFVPQRVFSGQERMVGAIEDIVRRGRVKGIGCTLISQRPATINKDVLTQVEIMVAHQLTGPQDRKAVQAWVEAHDEAGRGPEFLAALASLKRGHAWFWSPAFLNVLAPVAVRGRSTFDSSATPKLGAKVKAPKALAEVDIEVLRGKLSATIEKAKDNDPAVLKRRIRELESQLAKAGQGTIEEDQVNGLIQVAVNGERKRYEGIFREIQQHLADVQDASRKGVEWIDQKIELMAQISEIDAKMLKPTSAHRSAVSGKSSTPRPRQAVPVTDTNLGKAERAVLTALIQCGPCSKARVALVAGYSMKSGSFANTLSKLRTSGLLEGDANNLAATAAGVDALPEVDALPTGEDLVQHWISRTPKCAGEILRVLVDAYPAGLAKADIASRCPSQYAASSGSFANALSQLRTLGLIKGYGEMRATRELVG